jgi:hypothetical protein
MRWRYGWLLVALVLAAGCGGGKFAPVSGIIRLNGQPLAGASVSFEPVITDKTTYGPGSHGITDANGQYKLRVSTPNVDGALIGKHTVRISRGETPKGDPGGAHLTKELLPARYNSQTDLSFDVLPEGSTSANFDLKKK